MSAILSLLIHLFAQSYKTMFDYGIRWAFSPRPPIHDEEAVTDTTPLLRAEGSDRTEAPAFAGKDDTGSHPRTAHIDRTEAVADSTPPAKTPSHQTTLAEIDLPSIPTLSLARNIPHKRSVFESFRESKMLLNWQLSNTTFPKAEDSIPDMRVISILAPIKKDLNRLKALTPKSLPPPNPHVRTRCYAQSLKHRLLPVGQFIVDILDQVAEDERGALELGLCRYIAINFWPLPANEYTHLKIHEMYHNVLYLSRKPAATSPMSETSVGNPSEEQLSDKWVGSLLEEQLALPITSSIPINDRPSQDTIMSDPEPSE
ncbi:hypothetical protein PtrCC142_004849 [Pyrenophora tritici-repentis]|nr:hypothetical protein PtrSN001A_005022 [Pyrenophora tritici-repentis]KAI1541198.1 hypothetical protein PtrSN001C_004630 [Pyrenophora tritici-repentis]KAI1570833.1 hypothetical protein PtrEW4_005132 [Pyrenophora tritici-repentis]KAI1579899.1 hypothetical protein PtrEW7m1_005183 [Pyrenophora tritici-repentis]KAI1602986.1 hypothetical protein PtrCC142_004849 [Pyrenophora tritici-repentis]